jgi:hypothetical protein
VSKGRASFDVCPDFAEYYRWLIYKEFPNLVSGLSLPKHSPHVTLANPKIHTIDQKAANHWHGVRTVAYYNPETIHIGGLQKNFVGFYCKIESGLLEIVRHKIITSGHIGELHLSICTTKGLRK